MAVSNRVRDAGAAARAGASVPLAAAHMSARAHAHGLRALTKRPLGHLCGAIGTSTPVVCQHGVAPGLTPVVRVHSKARTIPEAFLRRVITK